MSVSIFAVSDLSFTKSIDIFYFVVSMFTVAVSGQFATYSDGINFCEEVNTAATLNIFLHLHLFYTYPTFILHVPFIFRVLTF